MKTILALIISLNTYASLPPTTLSGQSATVKPTTFNFKTPYSQSTSLGGVNSLIETGNENMLVNPSFEAQTLIGWTCTTGTCTVEKSIALGGGGMFSSGVQSMKIVPTANIFDISQTITTPTNIQTQGSLGIVYNIPATCTTAQIQSKIDGAIQNTISTSNIIIDGKFHSIELPIVFGSASATIRMFSTATCTGNIYVDAAYIKQGLGLTNLMLDSVYSAKITTTTGVVADENKDFISSCTAANPTVCTFTSGIFTVAPNCTQSQMAGTLFDLSTVTSSGFTINSVNSATGAALASRTSYISCQKSGNDYLASSTQVYQSSNVGVEAIEALTSTSTYGSTNTGVPVLNITRNTNLGILRVDSTAADGTSFTVLKEANVTMSASGTINGNGSSMSLTKNATIFTTGSFVSGIFFAKDTAYTNAPIFQVAGSIRVSPGDVLRFQGDTNMPVNVAMITATPVSSYIVGSFAGVPTTGYAGNVDDIIASYGATVNTVCATSTTCPYLDQIGNFVSSVVQTATAGQLNINFNKTYLKVKCTFNLLGAVVATANASSCSNCNTLQFDSYNSSSVRQNTYGTIFCKGSY